MLPEESHVLLFKAARSENHHPSCSEWLLLQGPFVDISLSGSFLTSTLSLTGPAFLIEPQHVIFYVMCWRWCCTCGLESGRYLRTILRGKTLCESTALSRSQDRNVIHRCIYFSFSGMLLSPHESLHTLCCSLQKLIAAMQISGFNEMCIMLKQKKSSCYYVT